MTTCTDPAARRPSPSGRRAAGTLASAGARADRLAALRAGAPFSAGLILVTLVGAGLRLRHLTALGFGSDEAVYARQGHPQPAVGAAADQIWPAVRAHPPLLGLLVSALPGSPDGDLGPRVLVVGFGVLTIVLTGLLGHLAGGRAVGLLAAGILALDPYHVDLSRQVLVDVPMAALVTAGLLAGARWLALPSRSRLVAAAACMGAATLFKETAVLSAFALFVTVAGAAASGRARDVGRSRDLGLAAGVFALVAGLYPALLLLDGGWQRAGEYLGWQLARPANAGGWFYAATVLPRVGAAALLAAALGVLAARRPTGPARRLLLLAVGVPLLFYLLWPTKGYPYLAAVMPPIAVLAAAGLRHAWEQRGRLAGAPADRPTRPVAARSLTAAAIAAVTLVAVPATARSTPPPVAAATGVPGVREAARWLKAQPAGQVITADPAVANIVRYYSGRPVQALPSGRDPALLNPAYRPAGGPAGVPGDPAARSTWSESATPMYVIWDTWSAASDPRTAGRLVALARGRQARVAHVEVSDPGMAGGHPSPTVVVFRMEP